MEATLLSKVALRLPNFITMFFSIMLVTGFRLLGDHFHWISAPRFSFATWNDALVLGSFACILVFVVTAWIGFGVLVERDQYTLSFSRFSFDILRFGLMFAMLMWSFLSEKPGHYQIFIFGMALYHFLLIVWYVFNIGSQHQQSTFSTRQDLMPHMVPFIIYLALGIYYHVNVPATDVPGAALPATHVAIVLLMMLIVFIWCMWRLSILKKRVLSESAVVGTIH